MASHPYRAPRRAEVGDSVDDALRNAREAIDRLRATLASLRPAANGDRHAGGEHSALAPAKPEESRARPHH